MPGAVANNAVAALKNGIEIYSVMGVGPKKTWDDITNKMYILRLSSKKWTEGRRHAGSRRAPGRFRRGRSRASFCVWGICGGRTGKRNYGRRRELLQSRRPSLVPRRRHSRTGRQRGHRRDIATATSISSAEDRRMGRSTLCKSTTPKKIPGARPLRFPELRSSVMPEASADDAIVYVDGAKIEPDRKTAIPTLRPTNAGWGRSTTKIPTRSNGANCLRIPGQARFGIVAGGGEKEHQDCVLGWHRHSAQLQRPGLRRQTRGDLSGNFCF